MPQIKKGNSRAMPIVSSDEVRRLVGPVADTTIAAILASGASAEEVEVAAWYLSGEGDRMDRLSHPMSGRVERIYDILSEDELYMNDEP